MQEAEGDRGANSIPTKQGRNLHALWDGLLGSNENRSDLNRRRAEILQKAEKNGWCKKAKASANPQTWLQESEAFAKTHIYTPEVPSAVEAAARSGQKVETVDVPREYLSQAGHAADERAGFAAARLAAVLEGAM